MLLDEFLKAVALEKMMAQEALERELETFRIRGVLCVWVGVGLGVGVGVCRYVWV